MSLDDSLATDVPNLSAHTFDLAVASLSFYHTDNRGKEVDARQGC